MGISGRVGIEFRKCTKNTAYQKSARELEVDRKSERRLQKEMTFGDVEDLLQRVNP